MGAGLAFPLCMQVSRLVGADPGDRPVRMFIYFVPHGQPIEYTATPDIASSQVLGPLEPVAAQTNILRGISMNDGANNHEAIRATLTGFAGGGNGDSIDVLIAEALGETPHALGAIPYEEFWGFGVNSHLIKRGTWVRPTESPIDAADDLLGSIPDPGAPDEGMFREMALSLTEAELESLQSSLSSLTRERDKVTLHLDAIRELKAGAEPPPEGCSMGTLPGVEALAGLDVLDQNNFALVLQAHLQVAAQAFVCGSARVITLQNMWVNAGLNFGFPGGPGIAKGHHDPISHSFDANGRTEFATCQRWFYQQLMDHFLATLQQPDPLDPSNTVLDNTVVYVCSEVSDGANHNSDASQVWINGQNHDTYLPSVLIGGGGGCLKPGGIVDLSRFNTDVFATLAQVMGVPMSTIGGQSISPIAEVLV